MEKVLSEQTLAEMIRRVVEVAHPQRLILFGSAARGEMGPHSDVDLLVVVDQPEFTVLRDYAEPGATRRMHSHDAVRWIVFTLVTGKLVLTFEGEAPIEVEPGQVLHFKGTTRHTFRNIANVTATIVEVFGKTGKEE